MHDFFLHRKEPYQCVLCQRNFARHEQLHTHMKLHERGNKCFDCSYPVGILDRVASLSPSKFNGSLRSTPKQGCGQHFAFYKELIAHGKAPRDAHKSCQCNNNILVPIQHSSISFFVGQLHPVQNVEAVTRVTTIVSPALLVRSFLSC